MNFSRRRLIQLAATVTALPLSADPSSAKLHIVIAGAHPGDPECGCAGTIARYTDLGHKVTLLYLNRGQGYCGSAPLDQCGAIRTREAQQACAILKAQPVFADQYDGRAIIDTAHYQQFHQLLEAQKPDILFTHWPLDEHRDHRALASLVLDSWLKSKKQAALYFYEVADDTMMFSPTEFVDISGVESRRRAACYAHQSQQPDKWYPHQVTLTRFRGAASGFPQAEAFARHWESKKAFLP